jgi:hypothetical protein
MLKSFATAVCDPPANTNTPPSPPKKADAPKTK